MRRGGEDRLLALISPPAMCMGGGGGEGGC
jgi:hypothetical protein